MSCNRRRILSFYDEYFQYFQYTSLLSIADISQLLIGLGIFFDQEALDVNFIKVMLCFQNINERKKKGNKSQS